ncbi:MAG: SUMF1/EgtB/PvdO family nonheme iron enzyme, partial [Planctomycetes bacterium]|nr:SUMF1/EgtB/PvdO family nonheme iron enzyme [Planctomycetota bacterium]
RILTGQAPYPESDIAAALARARRGDVTPPSVAAPDRSIPGELERICRKALAARPEDRYGSAREMHDALQAFVEGTHDAERREREAARLLEEASRLRDALGEAERRAAELKAGVEAERARLPDHAPEEAKGALWRFLSEAKAASDRSEHAFSSAAAAYRAVLRVDPDHRAARSALAGLHAARRTAAEERGDLDGARLHEGLARQHGAGSGLVELREEGLLRLESDPPGAEVLLSRYVERGLLLEAGEPVRLGATPLERPLPRGSYVATLRGPGLHEARYPFVIDRRPEHRAAVRLHPEGSIPPGFVQVPAGESILGGDTDLFSALPRERRVLPEIFAAGLPVTLGEYCAFLDERCAAQPPGSALGDLLPSFGKEEYAARGPDGRFAPAPRLDPRMPVMGIPLEAMDAYCGWIGRRLGRSVRLLDEREWERCARGADGRLYPWVNGFDWAFAKGGRSREGDPFLEPVGSFPRDVSSFGVRDMAGSIREACLGSDRDRDHDHDGYGPCRGGSWFNPYPFVFRADARTTYAPKRRATDIGFRVGYRLEEPS